MRRRVLLMLKLIVRKDLAASMIQTAEVTNESAEILIAKDNSFESGPASLATSTLLSSWRSRMSTHYHGLPTEPRVCNVKSIQKSGQINHAGLLLFY